MIISKIFAAAKAQHFDDGQRCNAVNSTFNAGQRHQHHKSGNTTEGQWAVLMERRRGGDGEEMERGWSRRSNSWFADTERAAMKKQEELMMLEALGLKPQQQRLSGKTMEQHEIDELCRKGNIADEERGIRDASITS